LRNVKILSTGVYLPKPALSLTEVEGFYGLRASGECGSRYIAKEINAPEMGALAAKNALDNAGLKFSDIDALIGTCGTHAQIIPSNAALIMRAMKEEDSVIPAFDINSTCLSFLAGLDTLSYLVAAGKYKRVLLVASDKTSPGLLGTEHASLFSDGAAAVIIEQTPSGELSAINCSKIESYPSGSGYSEVRLGSNYPSGSGQFLMDGKSIYKIASKMIKPFVERLLQNESLDDYRLVIPHQASAPALKIIQKKLELENERFLNLIGDFGNTVAASIPMGLHNAISQKKISRGDKVLLLGTSAGFSIGGMGLTY
jgi:3-oxoacyl-[acyl-carrier-protein] synthase III